MLITTKASRMSAAEVVVAICGITFLLTTKVLSTTLRTEMSSGSVTESKYPPEGIDALLLTIAVSNDVRAVASAVAALV